MLLEQGKEVKAMIHKPDHAFALGGLKVKKVYAELLDVDSLIDAFQGATRVYHCAALISIVPGTYDKLFQTNVVGTRNVLAACKANKIKRMVHVASVEAFGNDGSGEVLTEDKGFRPECAMIEYGATKALAGLAVLDAVKRGDIEAPIVAPVGILGPNDWLRSLNGRIIRDFANGGIPAYNTGGGFDYVDARDVAKTIIAADEKGRSGEIYLCRAEHVTTEELMALASRCSGMPMPPIAIPTAWMMKIAPIIEKASMALGKDPMITRGSMNILASNLVCSNAKARTELGVEFRPLKDTVRETYEWYVAQGDIKPSLQATLYKAIAGIFQAAGK
jgi:dihydroflavonol-4-reductase